MLTFIKWYMVVGIVLSVSILIGHVIFREDKNESIGKMKMFEFIWTTTFLWPFFIWGIVQSLTSKK